MKTYEVYCLKDRYVCIHHWLLVQDNSIIAYQRNMTYSSPINPKVKDIAFSCYTLLGEIRDRGQNLRELQKEIINLFPEEFI